MGLDLLKIHFKIFFQIFLRNSLCMLSTILHRRSDRIGFSLTDFTNCIDLFWCPKTGLPCNVPLSINRFLFFPTEPRSSNDFTHSWIDRLFGRSDCLHRYMLSVSIWNSFAKARNVDFNGFGSWRQRLAGAWKTLEPLLQCCFLTMRHPLLYFRSTQVLFHSTFNSRHASLGATSFYGRLVILSFEIGCYYLQCKRIK